MLSHHLPPWSTLKARLKATTLASPRKGPQGNVATVPKASSPPHFDDKGCYGGDGPFTKGAVSAAGYELGGFKSGKNYARGIVTEVFDEDRIYLKHEDQGS